MPFASRNVGSDLSNFASAMGPSRPTICKSNAFDQDHLRLCGAMAHLARFAILFAIQPLPGLLRRFELKDNDALGFPIAFEHFSATATHDVFPAIFLHSRAGKFLVFSIAGWIENIDFNDDVSGHFGREKEEFRNNRSVPVSAVAVFCG